MLVSLFKEGNFETDNFKNISLEILRNFNKLVANKEDNSYT